MIRSALGFSDRWRNVCERRRDGFRDLWDDAIYLILGFHI